MDNDQSISEGAKPRASRRPADTALTQQRLPACKPVLDPCWVIFIFVSIGVILIPIGATCFAYGRQPVEQVIRYDDTCFPAPDNLTSNQLRKKHIQDAEVINLTAAYTCTIGINISRDMNPPIYVYYELDGFYQNHRRYVKSRSDSQLAGLTSKPDTVCQPEQYLQDNKSKPILPCGLVAWSFFNDTFKIVAVNSSDGPGVVPKIRNDSLASRSDRNRFADKLGQNFNPEINQYRGGNNLTGTMRHDQRFVLWMKTAPLPKFRKLWGTINDTVLKRNTKVYVEIVNRYNTFDFGGEKKLVLGTTTWLGGKNEFLGLAYLIAGATSWVLGVSYAVLLPLVGRKIGNIDGINWPDPRTPH